jgi:hypothetical protein
MKLNGALVKKYLCGSLVSFTDLKENERDPRFISGDSNYHEVITRV